MADIRCPHCFMWIPVSGQGAKTIVKMPGLAKTKIKSDEPKEKKPTLKEILGDHFDAYWVIAKYFGEGKNFSPIASATEFTRHINSGVSPDTIKIRAARTRAGVDDSKYMPQFVKWLAGQDFTLEGTPNEADEPNRLSARRRVE